MCDGEPLCVALDNLKLSIKKTWGEIPAEIADELKVLDSFINVVPVPPAEQTPPSEPSIG